MSRPLKQSEAAPGASCVWIEFVGGPRDGLVTPVAPSLLSAAPLWIRHRSRQAIHVYRARKGWRGEKSLTLYHRGAFRVVG